MEKIKTGDWVYYDGGYYTRLIGAIGYVVSCGESKCTVHFVKDNQGERIDFKYNFSYRELILAREIQLDEQALKNMIDLALDTGDKEWFMELTEKYKKIPKCGQVC